MRSGYSILVLLLTLFAAKAQETDSTMVLQRSISSSASLFTTDHLGNLYMVEKDRIIRYSPEKDSTYTQSFKWLGKITSIDAGNSLRIMAYYAEQSRLIFMDNTLSIQGDPIDLVKLGFTFTSAACQSPNNYNLWLFDTNEFELVRLDNNFKIVSRSGNLLQLLGYTLFPDKMLEHDNKVFLHDKDQGVLVFDMFGTYLQKIPIPDSVTDFDVIENNLIYISDGLIHFIDLGTFQESSISLPEGYGNQFTLSGKGIWLKKEGEISFFSFVLGR